MTSARVHRGADDALFDRLLDCMVNGHGQEQRETSPIPPEHEPERVGPGPVTIQRAPGA